MAAKKAMPKAIKKVAKAKKAAPAAKAVADDQFPPKKAGAAVSKRARSAVQSRRQRGGY